MVALTHSPEHDYEILPMNGSSPLVRVVNMQGLVPRGDVLVQGLQLDDDDDDGPDPSDDGDPDEDDPLPEHDWELAAWADESTREMQEWVDDLMSPDFSQLDDEDKALVEAEFGPEIDGRETFTMLGSWSHGSSVALVRSSGQVWMGEIREPRLRADGRGLRRSGSEPRRQPVAGWGDVWVGRTMVALAAWSQRNSRWLRWVVALGVAVAGAIWVGAVVRFGVETGWDWFDWVMSVVLTVGLLPWPVIAAGSLPGPDVARARPGIAFYGFVMDVVIAPDRLVTVVPGEESVALRLRDPEDAVFLAPEEIGADLNASQAAEKLRSWSWPRPPPLAAARAPRQGWWEWWSWSRAGWSRSFRSCSERRTPGRGGEAPPRRPHKARWWLHEKRERPGWALHGDVHHNVLVHELTATDLRRSRLHLFWIQLLFTVGCVGLLVSDTIVRELGEGPWRLRFPLVRCPTSHPGFS